MGSALRLPHLRERNLSAALDLLTARGLRVAATVARGGTPYDQADLLGPLALLLGKGDFLETMFTALNCGFDSDCTAATAGAVHATRGVPVGLCRGLGFLAVLLFAVGVSRLEIDF